MRKSSPSSKSTIQIGHVSRPIDSGSGSAADIVAIVVVAEREGPARGRAGGRSASDIEGSLSRTRALSSSAAPGSVVEARGVSSLAEDVEGTTSLWMSRVSSIGDE